MNAKRFAFLTAFTWAASCVFGHALLTEPVGTSSATQTATVTITTAGTLQTISVLTQGAIGLDFNVASGGTCSVGTAYAVGDTCTVNYTFKPTRPWIRYGGVALADSAGNLLGNTYLTGTGSGPQPIFSSNNNAANLAKGSGLPEGVALDGSGNIYVADEEGGVIKEIVAVNGSIPPNPTIRTLFSSFYGPECVAVDGSGNVYFSDPLASTIQEIVAVNGSIPANPAIRTLVPGSYGDYDTGCVAVDGSGNVYFTVPMGGTIQEIAAVNGSIPANPTYRVLAGVYYPGGLAVDGSGNVYFSNYYGLQEIVAVNGSIPPNPTIRTVVPYPPLDISGLLAVDGGGNVYGATVRGTSMGSIGSVVEIMAVNGSIPDNPTIKTVTTGGAYSDAFGVAVDGSGNVYVSYQYEYENDSLQIVEVELANPPALNFAPTPIGETSSDSPQSVTVGNFGNAALTGALSISANWDQVAGSGTPADCTASFSLAPGAECNLSLSFEPTEAGAFIGFATLTDNALNVTGAIQQILLGGVGQSGQLSVSPTTLPFGNLALGQQKDLPLQITNSGTTPVTLSPVINGPSFTVPPSENGCPAVIPAGHSCSFSVRFLPRTYGGHTDTLTLADPEVNVPTIQLTGQTLGVGAEIGLLNFGTIPNGTTAILSVPVVNYAVAKNVTFSTSINGPSFKVLTAGNTCLSGVTAAQQCTIPVEFSPAAVGGHKDFLTITASSGDVSVVTLKGIASQP
jgi:hypothetical protein